MKRIAALADVHGNLPALEAVLAEVRAAEPELVVFCGDVALGYLEAEAIDFLRGLDLPARFVRGNCETEMVEQRRPDAERAAWLDSFEPEVRLEVDGLGEVAFCHGTPRDENEILTEFSPAAAFEAALADEPAAVVVGGHTHMQFARPVGSRLFVNAGSVGRAYGEAGAFWALLGPAVVLRRTLYDFDAAAERLAATEWAEVAREAASPPARVRVGAFFERQAGREPVLV